MHHYKSYLYILYLRFTQNFFKRNILYITDCRYNCYLGYIIVSNLYVILDLLGSIIK